MIYDPAVTAVSYTTSTSQNGQALKWRSYRAAGKSIATVDEPVERAAPAAHESPIESGRAADPFKDPFGDKKKLVVFPTPKPAPIKVEPEEAIAGEPAPSFPAEGASPLAPANGAKQAPKLEIAPLGPRSMEQELAAVRDDLRGRCPSPDDLKPLNKIKCDLKPETGEMPPECSLGNKQFVPRAWGQTTFTWTASAVCHKPLYFEEVQLERYGHTWGPIAQPLISAGHFFVTVPFLPYGMGLYPPNECIYTLGYYRPGSCAPYTLDPLPLSVRAGLMEAGAVAGLVFLLP